MEGELSREAMTPLFFSFSCFAYVDPYPVPVSAGATGLQAVRADEVLHCSVFEPDAAGVDRL